MAKKYYSTLTKIGLNAIARATTMNEKVKFSKFCVGDSEIHPDVNTTALGHEVWQGSLSSIVVDETNPNWIVLTCIISATVGGFTIREVGIKDEDGNLLAVASYPETYKPVLEEGAGKDLIVRVILEVSNTECVELKIDPTVSLATRADLEEIENKKADKEDVKKLEKKVEDAEKKVETVERKVAEGIESSDVSSKPIEFVEASTRILPQTGDSIKTIVAKVTKYLKELKTVAFTGRYSDLTGVPTSFTPATHYHDDRYLGKTSKASDSYKLDGYNSSYFAKSNEVGQLQSLSTTSKVNLVGAINELFRLSVDGKQSHINGINRLLGSSSGLTTNSSWNDIKYFWENSVFEKAIVVKKITFDAEAATTLKNFKIGLKKILYFRHDFSKNTQFLEMDTQNKKMFYNPSHQVDVYLVFNQSTNEVGVRYYRGSQMIVDYDKRFTGNQFTVEFIGIKE